MSDLVVRYAESDDDTIWVHQFLLAVAGPTLPGPVDGPKSITEVWRVCANANPDEPSFGLMALKDDRLVGTLGIIAPIFWWSKDQRFMVNRWFFALPGFNAGRPLLKEAKRCATTLGMELQIYSEERGTLTILNKSSKRKRVSDVLWQHAAKRPAEHPAEHDADNHASVVADGGRTGEH